MVHADDRKLQRPIRWPDARQQFTMEYRLRHPQRRVPLDNQPASVLRLEGDFIRYIGACYGSPSAVANANSRAAGVAPDAMVVVDKQENRPGQCANSAFGYAAEELIGSRLNCLCRNVSTSCTPSTAPVTRPRRRPWDWAWRCSDAARTAVVPPSQLKPARDSGRVLVSAASDITNTLAGRGGINIRLFANNVAGTIVAADTDFHTAWNRTAEELYGWTAAEALGQARAGIPSTGRAVSPTLRILEQTGTVRVELMQHHRDGREIHVESNSIALRDAGGEISGYRERHSRYRRAQAKSDAAGGGANLLRTLIDNVPDYIFAKDREGRFILSNVAHAQGAGVENPDELVGKLARDVYRRT
jgi:PAS domain S-box-containing protein